MQLLDNTFVGTLAAGIVLALFGLYLYRSQKRTDIEFEEIRKKREFASLLFSKIQIAIKNYEAQLNIHNGKNAFVSNLYNLLNQKFDNHFKKDFDRNFNTQADEITVATDNLIAALKIDEKFTKEIEQISKSIPTLNLMLLGVSAMHLSKSEDINELDKLFHETSASIIGALQTILTEKGVK